MSTLCPQDGRLAIIPHVCRGAIDFTLAFENYILILIPSALLVLLGPVRLRTVWARSVKVASPTTLQLVKTFSALLFAGFSLSVLVTSSRLHSTWHESEVAAASVTFAASLVCLALSHYEHLRSFRPSVLLQLYLMIAVVVNAVHLRSVWLRTESRALRVTSTGQLASSVVFLIAESFHKQALFLSSVKPASPQDINGLFSQRLYLWLNRLLRLGYKNILKPIDLDQVDEDLASPDTYRLFRRDWVRQTMKDPDRSLYRIIATAMFKDFWFPAIPKLLFIAVSFAQPFFIERVITYVDAPASATKNEGSLLVLAALCIYSLTAIFQSWYEQSNARFETKIRSALIVSIHDKALRAKPDAEYSPLTLMNVDVERAVAFFGFQHEFWTGIIVTAIALYLLELQVGLSCLAPAGLVCVIVVLMSKNGAQVAPKQKLWLAATQKRISFITNNAIASMKNIKMMGLAQVVEQTGTDLRVDEVKAWRDVRLSVLFTIVLSNFVTELSFLVTYGAYAIAIHFGAQPLNTVHLFVSLSVIGIFTSPMLHTIQYVPSGLQAFTAMSRIQKYLRSDEIHDQRRQLSLDDDRTCAVVNNVTVDFPDKLGALSSLNVSLLRGKCHLLVGKVGSGKSVLLKAVVGEIQTQKGEILLSTFDTTFCDQQPWLWNASIKQNIVGPTPFDERWFNQVMWACGLDEDFKTLPDGAETITGDDGSCLSGGQKNRISLARAVYARKRLLVADDILAGLDNSTEAKVFGRVFGPSGLLKKCDTTVLLATHSQGWVEHSDSVIVLDSGSCVFQGSPSSMPEQHKHGLSSKNKINDEGSYAEMEAAAATTQQKLEEQPTTVRNKTIYLDYLRSFGARRLALYMSTVAIPTVSGQLFIVTLDWWAAKDSGASEVLGLFTGMMLLLVVIGLASMTFEVGYAFLSMFPASSLYLHAQQWKALMHVAYPCWTTKDNGSTANRFSQDISLVDRELCSSFLNVSNMIFTVLASTIVILIAAPYLAVATPFMCAALYVIQRIYLRTSKQVRLLDLEAKAPLCSHFIATAAGTSTIRAYGWTEQQSNENIALLQNSQAPFYTLHMIQQWLQLVLDLLVASLITLLMGVVVAAADSLNSGLIGLALINFMSLGPLMTALVANWTSFDTTLGAVARISQFCNDLEQEPEGVLEPEETWPSQGLVEVKGLCASYSRDAPSVLKDVSITLKPGERVAICGRTGSGKSSLAAALFGLLHVTQGSVSIDGVDISLLSPTTLRQSLVALPQDPFFLPGTLRSNLAPPRPADRPAVTDAMMLDVLDAVGLRATLNALAAAPSSALDVRLNAEEMLTKGQRQLLAAARALLSPGRIVVIDEASSALDAASEARLLELVRTRLAGRVVIAIAHRLRTIMDYDTVVVMDAGRIVEVGRPGVLKDQEGGWFRKLLQASAE